MNYFNKLSPELIEYIFNKLNLDNLINLRDVDKRFKLICEKIRIKYLACRTSNWWCPRIWYYTNNSTYLSNENFIKTSKFLNYRSIFQLDKNLKNLTISVNLNFNFIILNELKLLEQLNILIPTFSDHFKLDLENLKIAEFYLSFANDYQLTLETSKLFAFKSSKGINGFNFNYPDKILNFETDYFNCNDSLTFNNLEYLKLNNINEFNRNILFKFKNLKIIDLNININDELLFNNLKEQINLFFNENKNFKISHIYLEGIKLINQDMINQLKWLSDYNKFKINLLQFQIKNYDLLKDNYDCDHINYSQLINFIKLIPLSFKNKFSNIHKVYANDHILNEDQFINFLDNLSFLSSLELINCDLSRLFYDKLINLIYLNNLNTIRIEEKANLEINFEFILNLKELEKFDTNQKINNIDLISRLIQKNKKTSLTNYNFKIDLINFIQINKNSNLEKEFEIMFYHLDNELNRILNCSIEYLNLNELIIKLNDFK